jgi:hypothetical protein
MAGTPLIVGSAALSNGKVAVLMGDTDTTTVSSFTYTTFDHLQVAILSPGGSAGLNDANALTFPSGGSPNGIFGNPSGGGAITAMPGGGMAVETWGSSNSDYYVQILDNSGAVTVAPFVAGNANGASGPGNPNGNIGAWSGGLVAAWSSSDEQVTQFQRLTNTGAASGSAITLAPGTGAPDPDGTPIYTWQGSMAVDSQGDVIFSFAAGDAYTSSKFLEYNSANQLIGSGTLGEKQGAVAFAAIPGGGFVTVDYTPTGPWNESNGTFPGFNLTIQTISASGAVTTVKTVNNAVGSGGQPLISNLAVSAGGTVVFQESGRTAYDTYDLSTGTLTRNAITPATPLATIPTPNGSGQVYGAAVSGSQVEAETLVICFRADTMIATPTGEVPVQTLKAGDIVLTAHNGPRPVTWVGTGKVLATRGKRSAATPIIVRKGALADNLPHRDLHVTKAHSLYIDDVLIPVEFLVNHKTILWDDRAQEVEIYHVELETHDLLIANGVPAESYRDDGNRWLFQNANEGWHLPPQKPYAPVLTGGPIVDAAWQRFLDRAGPRDTTPLTDDPDLHLLINGKRIDARERRDGAYIFRLPSAPASVFIASHAAVPSELGTVRDPRSLGVALRRVAIQQGAKYMLIDAYDERLTKGFHDYEPSDNLRWTNGYAELPIQAFARFDKGAEVTLHLGGATQYPDHCDHAERAAA